MHLTYIPASFFTSSAKLFLFSLDLWFFPVLSQRLKRRKKVHRQQFTSKEERHTAQMKTFNFSVIPSRAEHFPGRHLETLYKQTREGCSGTEVAEQRHHSLCGSARLKFSPQVLWATFNGRNINICSILPAFCKMADSLPSSNIYSRAAFCSALPATSSTLACCRTPDTLLHAHVPHSQLRCPQAYRGMSTGEPREASPSHPRHQHLPGPSARAAGSY